MSISRSQPFSSNQDATALVPTSFSFRLAFWVVASRRKDKWPQNGIRNSTFDLVDSIRLPPIQILNGMPAWSSTTATATTLLYLQSFLIATTHGGGPSGGGGKGFGRGAVGDYKCYQVCPPIVYPTGHDPYYETPYYQYDKEIHGGPFGPGTLNPYNPSDPKNYAGHWPGVKRQVPERSLPQSYPENFSGAMRSLFLQVQETTRIRHTTSASAYSQLRTQQLHQQLLRQSLQHSMQHQQTQGLSVRARTRTMTHPKGVMCLHVCPKNPTATPEDEPFGGPFGPDPYYFRGKTMFNNKKGHSGFSSSSSNFRNHQNEAVSHWWG